MGRDGLKKAAITTGAVVAGLVLLPVLAEVAAVVVLALAVVAVLALLSVAGLWHVARRHPLLDVLVAAWLLHRHDRRLRRTIDARSWPTPSTRRSPWAPPDPRSRSPW